jgi:ethanolamine ammonia-lyase small subunit
MSNNDPWESLKQFTAARIALGRTGTAEPLQAMLQFRLAHALARDAVYATMNQNLLHELQLPFFELNSQATTRHEYLQYPDKGRKLNDSSSQQLKEFNSTGYDLSISIADGLSATAINSHAIPVIKRLLPLLNGFSVAPICLVQQARVAIADEIGWLLNTKLAVILIGERPGLSSPDSLGAYLTWHPIPGTTDEARNCISNIRPEGLHYDLAADKLFFFIRESLRLQISGITLKDDQGKILNIE